MNLLQIQGPCETAMERLEAESFDLAITSPPYKDEDGYDRRQIFAAAQQLRRVLDDDRLAFVNFGHLAGEKFRPFEVADQYVRAGFVLEETIVWEKNHFSPVSGQRRLNNLTEFVFMFSTGKFPDLDRLSIGVPYADKSNVGRYAAADLRCAGNIWRIPYDTIQNSSEKSHPHRFPVGLPERCLKLCPWAERIIDPYAGSCTTAVAAARLKRAHVTAIDMNPAHLETGRLRVLAENSASKITTRRG